MMQDMTLNGNKIGFIGKGGAGKSTCLALLAQTLRQSGYQVCVLDTDSTNVGLHLALGIDKPPRRLIDYFGGMVFLGGHVACPADDPTLLSSPTIDLEQLPSDFISCNDSGVFMLAAGKLADFGIGAGCDGPLVKIARDLVVQRDGEPVILLVDLKAGIEDASRGVLIGMDRVIVVCDPSTAGLAVALCMKQMLDDLGRGAEPTIQYLNAPEFAELARRLFRQSRLRDMHVILNRVPDQATEAYMCKVLARDDIEPIAVIPEVADLRSAWLHGETLPTDATAAILHSALERLECASAATVGIDE